MSPAVFMRLCRFLFFWSSISFRMVSSETGPTDAQYDLVERDRRRLLRDGTSCRRILDVYPFHCWYGEAVDRRCFDEQMYMIRHNLDIDLSGFFDQQIFKMCLHIAADIRCYTRLSLIWSISFCSSPHLNTTVDICNILAFIPCFSTWAFPLSVVKSANHWNQRFFAIISIIVLAKSISSVGCHSDRWYFKFPSFMASMNLLYL